MANIFKPRRGKTSVMNTSKSNIILEEGEMFVEFPDTGIGTGNCKIKFGDGNTEYSNLPYAIDILNMVYPVGSVYLSINNINPSTFIGGTWELLSGGYVLKTIDNGDGGVTENASATDAATGNTGSTTLTKDQIPAHAHTMNSSGQCTSGGMSKNASHSHNVATLKGSICCPDGTYHATWSRVSGYNFGTSSTNTDHTHTVPNHTHTMQNAGGGKGHTHSLNNHTHTTGMPANISIYAWKRTA